MRRTQLPLDGQAYVESLRELERLIRATPDLSNLATIRTFLAAAPRSLLGERTVGECLAADDEKLRVLLHYMILGSSAMGDLHPASRGWLNRGGYPPPPWDPESRPYGKERVITYGGRLGAIVAWAPARSVAFGEGLTEVERRWVLALAIGAGSARSGPTPSWSASPPTSRWGGLVRARARGDRCRDRSEVRRTRGHGRLPSLAGRPRPLAGYPRSESHGRRLDG